MNIPNQFLYSTLDEVAECCPGISDATYRELWGRMKDDPRPRENYGSMMEFNEGSPNRLMNHWSWLTIEAQREIVAGDKK